MKNQTTQSQITGNTKQIEGIEFLKGFQNSMVEIDIVNIDGTCTSEPQFIESLSIVLSTKYISLNSATDEVKPLRILREQIFDIESEYSEKIIIHTCQCDYIINKL